MFIKKWGLELLLPKQMTHQKELCNCLQWQKLLCNTPALLTNEWPLVICYHRTYSAEQAASRKQQDIRLVANVVFVVARSKQSLNN